MDRRWSESWGPYFDGVNEPVSPKRGDAPTRRGRHLHVRTKKSIEHRKLALSNGLVKHAYTTSPGPDDSQTVPRALYGSHAAEHRARGNGLYSLTGQLLLGCYAFAGFHAFLLQCYPEVFTQLRYPPSFGHPLMLLPEHGSMWGWFFSHINGSIQQFVMRGVLGSLVLVCLLHLIRVILYPIASSEDRRTTVELSDDGRGVADMRKRGGILRRLLRTAWSAQQRFYRRRERFCARLVGFVCFGLTVIQTTSFFWGGWTLKAIGFPDIYLGALTKPGGLWGHETAADVVMQYANTSSFPINDFSGLKDSLADLQEPRNTTLLSFILLVGFALDAWGQYLQAKAVKRYLGKKTFLCAASVSLVVLSFASLNLTGVPSCNSNDRHWVDYRVQQVMGQMVNPDRAYLAANPPLMYSEYLPTRDGVRLAADIYLPHSYENVARLWARLQHRQHVLRQAENDAKRRLELASKSGDNNSSERLNKLLAALSYVMEKLRKEEQKLKDQVEGIPVYLEITRYNRRSELFWPFTLLSIWKHPRGSSVNIWSWQTQQTLNANHYAVVIVDTRGSGASFGFRSVDLGEEELEDSAELVQWSKNQWFSNGKVAGGGLSYDGMLGLSMAAGGGVDAVASLFTPMDVMGELVAPGGMLCHSFLNDYSGLTSDFELHGTPWRHMLRSPLQFPLHVLLGFMVSFGGTSAVLGHEADLPHAIRSHRQNWKMTDVVSSVEFYDDKVKFSETLEAAATSFGITDEIMGKLAENKVSVFMVSGFCDSATARGAIRLFSYMRKHAPEVRPQLILGNWNHGGRRSCDPFGGSFSCFEVDLYNSVLRYFDCRLKNKCWGGIEEEPPVHFWQTGSSEWRVAQSFPPTIGMKHMDMNLTNWSLSDSPLEWDIEDAGEHASAAITDQSSTLSEVQDASELGRHWKPQVLDLIASSFEHKVHDITQRMHFHWNMMELHEETRISAETVHGSEQVVVDQGAHNKRSKRTWVSKFLSALIAAFSSSYRHNGPANDLRKLFSQDENAYFMRFPISSPPAQETANSASEAEAQKGMHTIDYAVEYLSSTGEYSRWTIAQHPFRMPVHYGNRLFQPKRRPMFTLTLNPGGVQPVSLSPYQMDNLQARPLTFLTEPLSHAVEMIGSAFLHLTIFVKDCNEVSVFAYIEDLDVASGYSHYITEGRVVASNRPSKTTYSLPVGSYGRVPRSFSRRDHKPVDGRGETIIASLSFEPNAWTIREGHAIRLVLTGSDVDNFSLSPGRDVVLPKYWRVIASSSFLSLPISSTISN